MSSLSQFYIQRLNTMRAKRGIWHIQWEEAAERIAPSHRYSFVGMGLVNAMGAVGQKRTEEMYDATAAFAAQRFMSVIESLVTPQNARWHRIVPVDKMLRQNRAARMFFDDLNDTLFAYRNRPVANFVANSQQTYFGLGTYGNGILYIDAPDQTPGLRYRNLHLGETYFWENHAGIVDTVFRAFYWSNKQIAEFFGLDAPKDILEKAANPTLAAENQEILHVIEPRSPYNPTRLDAKGMRYASIYILVNRDMVLREGGYRTFPCAITRYMQAPGETYGRGPAQLALPAIKVLNEEKKTVLRQGHKTVDPVYLSYDDGKLATKTWRAGKVNSGGINADGKLLVQPMPVGNLAMGHELMDLERQVINDAFLITLFQILTETPTMTATEVLERAKEKGMLLAPTAGRMQAEFLGPMIEREIDLLAQQGLLPSPPGILRSADIEYKLEYENPMARMQHAEKAAGFFRALQVAADYAKNTGDPGPLDFFNFDAAMPEIMDIQGAPVAWTNTLDKVQELRQTRADQQRQQQMVEAIPAMAAASKAIPPNQQGQ